jgi:hypothetical protein
VTATNHGSNEEDDDDDDGDEDNVPSNNPDVPEPKAVTSTASIPEAFGGGITRLCLTIACTLIVYFKMKL